MSNNEFVQKMVRAYPVTQEFVVRALQVSNFEPEVLMACCVATLGYDEQILMDMLCSKAKEDLRTVFITRYENRR